ncbi:MAG: TonB-dependent receptor plug domain-containing protein [Deltaproteobacteria bacterium]|nr:TonB-dependent receptor plug domain-containing protein [Deltaproteobacteria bacterium]
MELDSEIISEQKVRTVQELLNLIPGVKAGSSSVSIRGNSSVAVFLDGMSLINTASAHRSVKWDLVSLEDIASLRILKGGGAVAYGDNSSGGVIIIKTKSVDRTKANLSFEAGNQNYWRARGNLTQKTGPWGLALNGDYFTTDGFRVNGDKEQGRAGIKLSWAPEAWMRWAGPDSAAPTLAADYGETRRGSPGLPKYATPHARSRDEALGVSLNFKALGWKNATSFTHFQNDYTNPDSGTYTKLRSWSIKEDLRKGFKLPLLGRISTGLMLSQAHAQGNKVQAVDEQSYSLFGIKSYRFKAVPVRLNLGLRANLYSAFDTAVNPEVKAVWKKGMLRLEAGFQMTNNTPTFRQRFYETSSTKPNPGLGMEYGTNYSFGASFRPIDWFMVSATVFYNQINDRITYMRGNDGVGQYQNVGETHLSGVDAFMSFTPFDWLVFRPSYTYLEAINDDTGLWLSAKPRHKLKANLQLRPWPGLMLACQGTYSSMVYTNAANSTTAPSYFTLDAWGEYSLGPARWFFRVENLMDEDYLYADGYPAPPRTWWLGMGWDF